MVRRPVRRHGRAAGLRRALVSCAMAAVAVCPLDGATQSAAPATIARVKASIVAVGSFEPLRNPSFAFAGTGFAVADGRWIATNDHVLPKLLNTERNEMLAVAVRGTEGRMQIRQARKVAVDPEHDLALLEIQ